MTNALKRYVGFWGIHQVQRRSFSMAHLSSAAAPLHFRNGFLPWSLPRDGGWLGFRDVLSAPHLLDDDGKVIKRVPADQEDMSQHSCPWKTGPRYSNAKAMENIASLTRCQSLARHWSGRKPLGGTLIQTIISFFTSESSARQRSHPRRRDYC